MPQSNPEPDSAANLPSKNNTQLLLGLGGEPLDGSGFEREAPEPEFEFNWTLIDQTRGGLR